MRAAWLVGAWLLTQAAGAQQLLSGQRWDDEKTNFLFHVKQIDEFIDRFNNQPHTLLNNELRKADSLRRVPRNLMLQSLFNQADPSWNPLQVQRFLRQVGDTLRPAYLRFEDPDWYATLDCAVLHQGQPRTLALTLQVAVQPDGAYKWVIVGARGNFLTLPYGTDQTTSLTPYSHGTDFMKLSDALLDQQNIRNYLPDNFEADALTLFVAGLRSGEITFRQVNRISYHFLQVEDWVFQVSQFNRPTRNAGWLISQLTPADVAAKQQYRRHVLQLH